MSIIFQILFWLSIFLVLHSYVLFPLILKIKSKNKKENSEIFDKSDNFPSVSILLAVYNEEKHILKKIQSTLETNYPSEKIEFLIGSDNSSDRTNELIQAAKQKYPQIKFYDIKKRTGKSGIINILKKNTENEILILTDAKVFFKTDTIYQLIKHFKNQKIRITGGILTNEKKNKFDISIQEDAYMNREMIIKYREGLVCGASMGVFGAIYAVRKNDLPEIPENFKTDDFFVSMKVISKGGKVIFEKRAVAEEHITGNFKEEFKRKVRIASGNFQNLAYFKSILQKPFSDKAFCYISHKVIRWLTPFLLLTTITSNLFLLQFTLYQISIIIFALSVLITFIDFMLKKINIHINLFRYFTHFYGMNIALFIGFIKYLKGIESAIWEPSKR